MFLSTPLSPESYYEWNWCNDSGWSIFVLALFNESETTSVLKHFRKALRETQKTETAVHIFKCSLLNQFQVLSAHFQRAADALSYHSVQLALELFSALQNQDESPYLVWVPKISGHFWPQFKYEVVLLRTVMFSVKGKGSNLLAQNRHLFNDTCRNWIKYCPSLEQR